ncbi:MAG: hypothetical protein ACI8P0_006276 [Planctomycetaceae bacterium]
MPLNIGYAGVPHWQSQWHTSDGIFSRRLNQGADAKRHGNASQLAGVSGFAYTRIRLLALSKRPEATTNYRLPETSG